MTPTRTLATSILTALFTGLLTALLTALTLPTLLTAPAAAAPPSSTPTPAPAPALSIAVDNGKTSTIKGDRASYTITVHNVGTAAVQAVRITQTLPTELRFISAGEQGKTSPGIITWTVNLAAGAATTLHTTALVQATPGDLLRLATVACASTRGQNRPLVCATHSDILPAGAAAAAAATAATHASAITPARHKHNWTLQAGIGIAAALVLAALATLLTARRRKSHHGATDQT